MTAKRVNAKKDRCVSSIAFLDIQLDPPFSTCIIEDPGASPIHDAAIAVAALQLQDEASTKAHIKSPQYQSDPGREKFLERSHSELAKRLFRKQEGPCLTELSIGPGLENYERSPLTSSTSSNQLNFKSSIPVCSTTADGPTIVSNFAEAGGSWTRRVSLLDRQKGFSIRRSDHDIGEAYRASTARSKVIEDVDSNGTQSSGLNKAAEMGRKKPNSGLASSISRLGFRGRSKMAQQQDPSRGHRDRVALVTRIMTKRYQRTRKAELPLGERRPAMENGRTRYQPRAAGELARSATMMNRPVISGHDEERCEVLDGFTFFSTNDCTGHSCSHRRCLIPTDDNFSDGDDEGSGDFSTQEHCLTHFVDGDLSKGLSGEPMDLDFPPFAHARKSGGVQSGTYPKGIDGEDQISSSSSLNVKQLKQEPKGRQLDGAESIQSSYFSDINDDSDIPEQYGRGEPDCTDHYSQCCNSPDQYGNADRDAGFSGTIIQAEEVIFRRPIVVQHCPGPRSAVRAVLDAGPNLDGGDGGDGSIDRDK